MGTMIHAAQIAALFVGFGVATVAAMPTTGIDQLLEAGRYMLALGAGLMLGAIGLRRCVKVIAPEWAPSPRGGRITGIGSGILGTLAIAYWGADRFDWSAVMLAVAAAAMAAGLWSLLPHGLKAKLR